MRIDGRDRQATESASNTSAASYVWRFSPPRWWSGSWQAVNRLSLPRKHYGTAVLIFRWTWRRRSEPSDLRRRSEPASINSRPVRILFLFKVKRQVHLQAKSTAESANREKSSKFASEPRRDRFFRWTSGARSWPKWAFFTQLNGESRKLKTRWRSETNSNSRTTK